MQDLNMEEVNQVSGGGLPSVQTIKKALQLGVDLFTGVQAYLQAAEYGGKFITNAAANSQANNGTTTNAMGDCY